MFEACEFIKKLIKIQIFKSEIMLNDILGANNTISGRTHKSTYT
jgi:hypothetical protein